MTDQDALVEAILGAPTDDAPRLVYADWLDEHGESEHAEFIRLQCRIERLRDDYVRQRATAERLPEVWARLQARWRVRYPHTHCPFTVIHRGMPEAPFSISAKLFLRESELWWPTMPIQYLHLTQWVAKVRDVAAAPYLRRLAVLELGRERVTAPTASALAASPYLGGLKWLRFPKTTATPEAIQIVSGCFGRIVTLV